MEPLPVNPKVTSYIIQAHEEEIKRIAYELHEGVSQTLYSIFTGLQLIESSLENPTFKAYTSEMVQLTNRLINELRWVSSELYPPSLDTIGLTPALKSYLKVYTSTFGILVDIIVNGEEQPLSQEQKLAVFRTCQEALNNAAKYADTNNVLINIDWTASKLLITIKDFGVGFNMKEVIKEKDCLGIASMKQRMELCSGELNVTSLLGQGTNVTLSVPILA